MTEKTESKKTGLVATLERVFVSACLGLAELVNDRSAADVTTDDISWFWFGGRERFLKIWMTMVRSKKY